MLRPSVFMLIIKSKIQSIRHKKSPQHEAGGCNQGASTCSLSDKALVISGETEKFDYLPPASRFLVIFCVLWALRINSIPWLIMP